MSLRLPQRESLAQLGLGKMRLASFGLYALILVIRHAFDFGHSSIFCVFCAFRQIKRRKTTYNHGFDLRQNHL
jgi:hypothetical protein